MPYEMKNVLVVVVASLCLHTAQSSKIPPTHHLLPAQSPPIHRHPHQKPAPATFEQDSPLFEPDYPVFGQDSPVIEQDSPVLDSSVLEQDYPIFELDSPVTEQDSAGFEQGSAHFEEDAALFDQHPAYKVFYQSGKSESELPVCSPWSVCSKVDTYDSPRVERQCRCPGEVVDGEGATTITTSSSHRQCSSNLDAGDGHTITDKTRQFKICEPVRKLPRCRYFRDVTWSYITYPDNVTQQVMHCVCPRNSVAYIIKRQAYHTPQGLGFQYSFACSPQSKLRCQRKEPCRLFTVKKRPQFEDVNTNTLCQCPHSHTCPSHHTDPGVIPGKTYTEDSIRTYSGYCM